MRTLAPILVTVIATVAPPAVRAQAPEPSFDYLDLDGRTVRTTHDLSVALTLSAELRFLGETHFREAYGGPEFRVSAAVWADDSVLVAVHAETLAGGGGGLDYSHLGADSLDGVPFTSRVDCFDLREESPADIQASGFLRFLDRKGFDFGSAMVLKRRYATDPAGRAEVVLTYGRRVPSCGKDGAVPGGVAKRVDREARAVFAEVRRGKDG